MRVKITLACTECKQRNYNTMKNKKTFLNATGDTAITLLRAMNE